MARKCDKARQFEPRARESRGAGGTGAQTMARAPPGHTPPPHHGGVPSAIDATQFVKAVLPRPSRDSRRPSHRHKFGGVEGGQHSRAAPLPQPRFTAMAKKTLNSDTRSRKRGAGTNGSPPRRSPPSWGWWRPSRLGPCLLGRVPRAHWRRGVSSRQSNPGRPEWWGGVVARQPANHATWSGRAKGPACPAAGASSPCHPSMGDGVSPLTTTQPRLSPPPPPPSRRARGGKRGLGKLGGAVTHSPGALRFRGWCCLGIQHTKQSHASRAGRPVHCFRGQTASAPHRPATQKPQRRRREDRAVVMKLESGGSTGALPHGWPLCTTQSACPVSEGPRQPPMDFK